MPTTSVRSRRTNVLKGDGYGVKAGDTGCVQDHSIHGPPNKGCAGNNGYYIGVARLGRRVYIRLPAWFGAVERHATSNNARWVFFRYVCKQI
jgi:hypothetical protein